MIYNFDGGITVSPSLQVDPAGGNPSTIAAGSAGYFGAYQPLTVNPSLGEPRIGFTYKVPATGSSSSSPTLPRASFVINLVFDANGGVQKSATTCTFMHGGQNQNASCSVSWAPKTGVPQMITVNIGQSTASDAKPGAKAANKGTTR